ncbi:unnamed protein product, partial [marine sediment metagenome]
VKRGVLGGILGGKNDTRPVRKGSSSRESGKKNLLYGKGKKSNLPSDKSKKINLLCSHMMEIYSGIVGF